MARTTSVLIAGAGPTGLTLACELARRGVSFRVVDAAPQPFQGSRAKGLQPRTLEVFEDLGIIEDVLRSGSHYPGFCTHLGPLAVRAGRINRIVAPTPAVPYPNLWMLPQWRTTELLIKRLSELGGQVEWGMAVSHFEQGANGIRVTLAGAGSEQLEVSFLIGCDGGHSSVRKVLGVPLVGENLEGPGIVAADLEIDGLDRGSWHTWPFAKGCMLTFCPLPGSNLFQMAAPLHAKAAVPETTDAGIRKFIGAAAGPGKFHVARVAWASIYRNLHARMVDQYRVGNVLLAGDAAHVHPPSGGQGLNTGVQDAYNLGWKLAAVLAGAPDTLLDTYEAERLPIAASVLGLAKQLLLKRSARRGPETQQLHLNYRGGPLAKDSPADLEGVIAGDRAPDAIGKNAEGQEVRLFQLLRGPHWTLLLFNAGLPPGAFEALQSWRAGGVRIVRIANGLAEAQQAEFLDVHEHAKVAYGARTSRAVLVRPDGYVGYITTPESAADIESYLARVIGAAVTAKP